MLMVTVIFPMSLNSIQLCKCVNDFKYTVKNMDTGWLAFSYFQIRNSPVLMLLCRAQNQANEALYDDILSENVTRDDANVCKNKREQKILNYNYS